MTPKRIGIVLVSALAACGGSTDQGTQDAGPTINCTADAPCVLVPGTPSSEKIQVVGEVNHYTVEVPQSFAGKRALLRIALSNAAPASPVRLVYLLENTDGSAVLASRGPAKGSGAQSIAGTFLVPGPGTYQLLVRDATNQNKDSNNPYTLSATVLEDPDTAEPDDTPPQARVNQPAAPNAATPEAKSGEIASQGDLDLLQFELTQDGLVHWTVTMAQPTTQLQLRARILKRSTSAPDDVGQATPVAEVDATKAGDALNSDLVRFLAAGKYLVALDDKAGTESDSATTWTTALQLVADPDPNEQTSRNDTAATATTLGVGQSKQGAIGSQGDADWYEIALPTVTTPKIVQLTIDPGGAANDVELDWAVGDVLATPAGACDVSCGPVAFCTASNLCGYAMHALHHFTKGEHAVQSVRLRHMGAARTMRMVVTDQGGDERSNGLYTVSAALLDDPDPNELNDTLATSTPTTHAALPDGGDSYSGTGMISWWEFIDGLTTAQQEADVDYYQLDFPPRDPAPPCPDPSDAGTPDAGDAATPLCTPDGGATVYLPHPDYGVVAHWRGPTDGTYRLGLSGTVLVDGGTACAFAFDETRGARDEDGGYVYGDQASDVCFCVPSGQADKDKMFWRIEAAHRPTPPGQNKSTDQPYQFRIDLHPGPAGLQTACDGGCAPFTRTSSCPGF